MLDLLYPWSTLCRLFPSVLRKLEEGQRKALHHSYNCHILARLLPKRLHARFVHKVQIFIMHVFVIVLLQLRQLPRFTSYVTPDSGTWAGHGYMLKCPAWLFFYKKSPWFWPKRLCWCVHTHVECQVPDKCAWNKLKSPSNLACWCMIDLVWALAAWRLVGHKL